MNLSKDYLETISIDELKKLAELHGLYIPDDLGREFIIGEFLDYIDEEKYLAKADLVETNKAKNLSSDEVIPSTYNTNEITILLRDPMWIFAFWDLHPDLIEATVQSSDFETFFLRVVLPTNTDSGEVDFFDVEISPEDRKRYLHLSFDDEICRVDLCVRRTNEPVQILAQSNILKLPRKQMKRRLCIFQNDASPILTLSGLKLIKSSHFKNFRQAFRNDNEQ